MRTPISIKIMLISLAITLATIITGCPVNPPNNETLPVLLESYSYGPNGEYFTSNNDGSLMLDRPYAPATSEGDTAWISAQFSSTNGVCYNFELGNSISGVSSGDQDWTVEINSNGDIALPYVSFEEINPNSSIDFLACNDIGATANLPEIPFPEERAFQVTYDFPFVDEVTLDFPFVLRGDDVSLTDEEALLPISIYSESLDDVCYYYGFGPTLEYTSDGTEWNITSVLGARNGYSGMLIDFDNQVAGNEGFASIICQLPTKENAGKIADKLHDRVKNKVQTRTILAQRALEKKTSGKIVNGGKKRNSNTISKAPSASDRSTKSKFTDAYSKIASLSRASNTPNATPREKEASVTGDISIQRNASYDIQKSVQSLVKAKGLDKKFIKR